MRSGVVVSFVAFLLLVQPMLVMRAGQAQANPVYFSVEPVAVAPLNDINVSANGLETPTKPSPVDQFFTVEIHLRGATQPAVPAGVAGVEVHFYFGNILSYAVPTGFTNMIDQAGGVLSGAFTLYGIYAGFYDSNNNPIDFAPYTGAVYYEVAAAANGIWNGADGIVAKITFEITRQPQSSQVEQTVSFPLALVEMGLVDGNSVNIPHDVVQGTLDMDANTLLLAVDYLVRNYNATVGLIPEVPGSSTYWLYSGNFLASYALWRCDPSNSTLANIVTNISSTISKYVQTVSNLLNQYMILNSSIAAFNDSSDYTIAHYGDAVINITLNNGTDTLNPSDFADIAFLEALYYHRIGQVQNASDAYQMGASMFDGKGLNDTLFQNGAQKGQYQTFKLALYVYASKVLGQQFPPNAETNLLKMQAASGGFYTGYDENYSTNGTSTNVETTSLAILALLESERGGTININADGSIFPSTAAVTTVDNVLYTLVGNISGSIVVQRNGIIVDGNGYTLQGPGIGTGFSLSGVTNVTIENTTVTDFTNGIWLNYSSGNTFSGNNITANNEYGIWVGSASEKNTFSGNTVANNRYAIKLNASTYNTLTGNTVTANNGPGIWLQSSSGNTLSGNNVTANSNVGIKLVSSSNNTLSGNDVANNGDGIWLNSSSGNTLSGNDVTDNWVGIELVSSSGSTLSGNKVTANSNVGIELVSSSGSTLSGNTITANLEVGIGLLSSSGNTLLGNDVANNWVGVELVSSSGSTLSGNNVTANSNVGIKLVSSSGNSVFHNSFVNNAIQIHTESSNDTWDDGFPSGGNFWSDYEGSDSNHDGIGDLNYSIDANNVDRHPLMGTFNSFSASSEQSVETICNSTISGFTFNGTAISFNVSGDPRTTGFCRICIPTALMNESFNVFVNGTEVAYTLLPFSNSTHTYIYFSYTHSAQQVTVIPEASTLTILLLLVTLSSLTILSAKKRTRKRLA